MIVNNFEDFYLLEVERYNSCMCFNSGFMSANDLVQRIKDKFKRIEPFLGKVGHFIGSSDDSTNQIKKVVAIQSKNGKYILQYKRPMETLIRTEVIV